MESVVFGIDTRVVTESMWLAKLGDIALSFDESPKEMVCVLAERQGDIQWFTFRSTVWEAGAALNVGFFEDMLAGLELVTCKRHEAIANDLIIEIHRGGELALEVRTDGNVVGFDGNVPTAIARTGDAESFALHVLGWPGPIPWGGFGTTSRRVALRSAGRAIARPKLAKGGKRLPPVKVIRTRYERIEDWCGRSRERFDVTRAKPRAAAGKPVRLDVRVVYANDWIDLSGVEVVTGVIDLVSSYEGKYGVRAIDLGAVRELKYPGRLSIEGDCEAVVGKQLVRADAITIGTIFEGALDLPILHTLRSGRFSLPRYRHSSFVLPALETAKELTFFINGGSFEIRLPALTTAKLEIDVNDISDDQVAASTFDAPKLPRSMIQVRGRNASGLRKVFGLR
jgi:hypothetical protein